MRLVDADALIREFIAGDLYHAGDIEEKIDNTPTVGRWINVKDRMPENRQHVLVFLKESSITLIDWMIHGKWVVTGVHGGTITHWMPLPEPPKEGGVE